MRLANPWALALLPLVWAAAALVLRRGRPPALPFPDAARAPASRGARARLADAAPVLLPALALSLAAVALARPQSVRRVDDDDGRGVDIVLAVDSSLSMGALDFKPNRLEVAKDIAKAFVRGRVSDRIGLVTFGGAPVLYCPPTTDYDALSARLDALRPDATRTPGTAIGDGLASAARRLQAAPGKSKVIVLLTDGRSNSGIVDPITAAKALAALGVKVHAIGAAGRGPAMMPVDDPRAGRVMMQINDDLDEELLAEIARLTGGKSFRAQSRGELARIFAEIDALETSAVKRPPLVAADDRHAPFLAGALLLLLAEAALGATVLLRWP